MKSALAVIISSCLLVLASTADYETCNSTVLECIKDLSGGGYPVNLLDTIKVLWNKKYSIVWYSDYMVEKDNLTCVTTDFSLFGCTDYYWNSCNVTKQVSFKNSFNPFSKVFTIKEYENMTMSAYAVHAGDQCLGLYVCSKTGVKAPHITLYCPTDSVSSASTEIEEAKAKFTSCNINDGVQICAETC